MVINEGAFLYFKPEAIEIDAFLACIVSSAEISCEQQMSVMLHLLKPFPLSVSGPAGCSNGSRRLWTVNNQMLSKLLVSGLRYYCFRTI